MTCNLDLYAACFVFLQFDNELIELFSVLYKRDI